MKVNIKSIIISVLLLFVIIILFYVGVGVFISGPKAKYQNEVQTQKNQILNKNQSIKKLKRHVFLYKTYIGEDKNNIYWFNEVGKEILSLPRNTLRYDDVKKKVKEKYQSDNITISLGYGYDNAIYVVRCDYGSILLDYDTLKEVYLLKEGDV